MLTVTKLDKTYTSEERTHQAVRGISFDTRKGEFYTLLGPSGCGKSTTLRCIAGLEKPEHGEITIGHEVVFSGVRGIFVPSYKRNLGMVFQSYAIWPHMTVFDNVAFPLVSGERKLSKAQIRERVTSALSLVKLDGLASQPAPLLSGGQQQRVALARALAHQPEVLLLDEPLSNLDAKLREEMRGELADVQARLRVPALYVTHDQAEAMALATRIAVMHQGRIRQEGTPGAMYHRPADEFVATFLGSTNLLPGVVEGRDATGDVRVRTGAGVLLVRAAVSAETGGRVLVGIRPEHLHVHLQVPPGDAVLAGELVKATFLGPFTDCTVATGQIRLQAQVPGALDAKQGQRVYLTVQPDACTVLPQRDLGPLS